MCLRAKSTVRQSAKFQFGFKQFRAAGRVVCASYRNLRSWIMPSKPPNPVDVHVGGRVRMRRIEIDMSQQILGGHIGLTFQQIQKYEKGANRIGASRLQAIGKILEVPVAYFFDGAPGGWEGVDGNHRK